jgi:hypothetical protein
VNHHAVNFLVNDRIDSLMAVAARERMVRSAARSSSARPGLRELIAGALHRRPQRPELGTAARQV